MKQSRRNWLVKAMKYAPSDPKKRKLQMQKMVGACLDHIAVIEQRLIEQEKRLAKFENDKKRKDNAGAVKINVPDLSGVKR